jgi:hypothetical protein
VKGIENDIPIWIRYALAEKGPLQLRSIDSKSLLVQTTLFLAHNRLVAVRGLVDSGCSGRAFISKKFVGRTADKIIEYTILPVSIGNHYEYCLFFITNLADETPIIFGLPWLKRHNPYINWAAMSLTFNSWYCLAHCCPQGLRTPSMAPTLPDPSRSFHDLPVPGEPKTAASN